MFDNTIICALITVLKTGDDLAQIWKRWFSLPKLINDLGY